MRYRALGATVFILFVAFASAAAGARPPDPVPASPQFEEVVVLDFAPQPFHGGPPPHEATDAATDFHLLQGFHWEGVPKTALYSVSTAGCAPDCSGAAAQVNAGLDAWEVSGLTLNQGSPGPNPCDFSNSVSWTTIDGPGRILAATGFCVNIMTKEILGFRIVFDSEDEWSDSGGADEIDIQATAAHEGGHVLGLGHVNAPRARRLTMFFRGEEADTGPRTLGCGDRLGVNALYGTNLDCTSLPDD